MSASGAGAVDAGRQGGIQFEAAQGYLFATGHAVAEIAGFDPLEAGLDPLQLRLAAALSFQGHGLVL